MNTTTETPTNYVLELVDDRINSMHWKLQSLEKLPASELRSDMHKKYSQELIALNAFRKQYDFQGMSTEEQEDSIEKDLREIKDYYGDWKQVREVIDNLEDNDNERAYERHCTNY